MKLIINEIFGTRSLVVMCFLLGFVNLKSQTLINHLTSDEFFSVGFASDIDLDGDVAVVGSAAGYFHVYEFSDGNWALEEIFYDENFGDGEIALGVNVQVSEGVIAVRDWGNDRLYFYEKDDDNWELIDSLFNADIEAFGYSFALEYPYLIVSGYTQSSNVAQIFKRIGGEWILESELNLDEGMGASLAINDGFAIVGGWEADSVHVFIGSGSTWNYSESIVRDYESQWGSTFGRYLDLGYSPETGSSYLMISDPYANSANGRIQIYKSISTYFEKSSDFICGACAGGSVSIDSDFAVSVGGLDEWQISFFERGVTEWSYLFNFSETEYYPHGYGYEMVLNGYNLLVSAFSPGTPGAVYAYDISGITPAFDLVKLSNVVVSPNPCDGIVLIDAQDNVSISGCSVRNVYGQIVYEIQFLDHQSKFEIMIEGAPGLYIIELTTSNNESISKKIIKS